MTDVSVGGRDDLVNPSGKLENGVLSFSFGRLLNTGDPHDVVLSGDDLHLLYSYGPLSSQGPSSNSEQQWSEASVALLNEHSYTSPNGVWSATWTFSVDHETVTFNISCSHDGWLGLGISQTGAMLQTDFVMAFFDSNGALQLNDRFANPAANTGRGQPVFDTSIGGTDDLYDVSGSVRPLFTLIACFSQKSNIFVTFRKSRLTAKWSPRSPSQENATPATYMM